MFSEKLVVLLSNFTKVERNRFRKYLLSPYLNEQPELLALYDVCDKCLRDGSIESFDRKQIWQKSYPKKPFNDAAMRRLSSDLLQLALRFMADEARNLDPLPRLLDLQRLLEKNELKKHLAGVERNIEQHLENAEGQSTGYYLAQFKFHNNISNRAAKHLATARYAEKLAHSDYFLECFYLTQKLELYIGWLLYQGSRVAEKEVELPSALWERLHEERFTAVPLLNVYRQVVNCLREPEQEQHFELLLQSLDNQAGMLAKEDLRKCYFIAQNYCALKINQGKSEYYRAMFDIFKKVIGEGILLEGGNLSEGLFKNIVTVGLGVGEFAWAEQFVETYSPFLPSDIRENARTFNLAYLYFHQKKYADVLNLLQNVEYSDVVYILGAKIMLIQTYYEINEVLAMDSLIDSFRIFVRRNKEMSNNLKREYINYLNFVKKLAQLKLDRQTASDKFRQKVLAASVSTSKKWLLEKMAELEMKK
jgi:HEPN domain-containing protein